MRRTKVIATLGPSSDSPEMIRQLIRAGTDVVRLNFSHGNIDEHSRRANLVRKIAAEEGRYVALLGDLQGPKIRISKFAQGRVSLKSGQPFILDASLDPNAGDQERVGIDYKELVTDCKESDVLLLDDGRLELEVERIDQSQIYCKVLIGGVLSNNKGINRKGGGLSASALTDKDKKDIVSAACLGVDYLAVSFPRNADDMKYARSLLEKTDSNASLVAKIERAEAVNDEQVLDDIIRASEAVMVARGDLGVEIGDAELIGVQKRIIRRARQLNKLVITATQMMESMILSPMPTRAEVFDVANAVLDGTDAVMLSAETAAGEYPATAVEAMVRVILGAERHPQTRQSKHRMYQEFSRVDESIGLAAMYAANHLTGVKAIICMTETGATPLLMSRISSGIPIFALTPNGATKRKAAMFRGVNPVPFKAELLENHEINQKAVDALVELDVVQPGDLVIITKGDYVNAHGGTNTLKVVRVGQTIH